MLRLAARSLAPHRSRLHHRLSPNGSPPFRALVSLALLALAVSAGGCASMIAGSSAWFENQRADVEPLAAADLACQGKPLAFKAVAMDDYREVEATGCEKKVRYKLVKVAMISKWVKAGEVASAH